MKTNFKNIGLVFLATIALVSCNNDDEMATTPPSAAEFKAISKEALTGKTQKFTATAGSGTISLTSAKGVLITINGNGLTKNGSPVTGAIDITYVEIFDKGSMLVTNKPTMGIMADGNHAMLKSGGEFYIKASQGGIDLKTTANITLDVPNNLTGGRDALMTLWEGVIDTKDELAWKDARDAAGANGVKGGVEAMQNGYYVSFGNFGWANVDRFYSDPRPKTSILVGAPEGYDNTNSAIYLSYDGEGTNALAKLDTFTTAGLFSEHYGQIPVGLACHIIFVTEENGQWKYAIKGVTIATGAIYNFTLAETSVGTEAQLIAAINAIQ